MMLWLTCTFNRYRCLQRNLQCYFDQDFNQPSVMYICNTGALLKLPDGLLANLAIQKHIHIDNCQMLNFRSVGEKYTHALTMAKRMFPRISVVCSCDDDDIYLPSHLSEGWYGYNKACLQDMYAYKPQRSWFRYRDEYNQEQISLQENTLEPSIFADIDWILDKGYAPVSIRYHQQWLDPLLYQNKILIDPQGKPTLIYNWGDNTNGPDSWSIYKMSGSGQDNQQNFQAHARSSRDTGNGILTPSGDNSHYYNLPNSVRIKL